MANTQQQNTGAQLDTSNNTQWDVGIKSQQTGDVQHYNVAGPSIADAIVNAAATFGATSGSSQKSGSGQQGSFQIVSCAQQGYSASSPSMSQQQSLGQQGNQMERNL